MVPTFFALFIALLAVSAPVSGRPMVTRRGYYKQLRQEPVQLQSFVEVVGSFPEINVLLEGNQRFRDSIASSSNPNLLKEQTDAGQSPGFLFLGCSDSRVSEGTIFSAAPGTLFTERNIANRFVSNDINSVSVLSYAVSELGVDHVIVMGHYGCGGVGAAILPRSTDNSSYAGDAVQNWIEPIRNLFQTSPRPEIAKLREFNAANNVTEEPEFEDLGYRALVEENVKESVCNIANDPVMQAHWDAFNMEQRGGNSPAARKKRSGGESGPLKPVFVHGFVYDISNGQISDLGISVGPPGFPLLDPPSAVVKRHVDSIEHDHQH